MKLFATFLATLLAAGVMAQSKNQFRQLGTQLPTPNVYRAASGAPGPKYWQQRADYDMDIHLDEEKQRIYGEETITYFNNSPLPLEYLWVQLDQNVRAKDSDSYKIRSNKLSDSISFKKLRDLEPWFNGGFNIDWVKDTRGKDLSVQINNTMLRVNLEHPLKPNSAYKFKIKWWYTINDRMKIGGRSGLEYFPEEDNYIFTIAQFYPRMAQYNDYEGWQNKQFLGRGEFTLTFGNFDVRITVPSDHVLQATGELQNENDVLTATQQQRLDEARTANDPVLIVNEDEARENEKTKADGEKTWHFKAKNVRDFAFASSRKFLWDAQGFPVKDRTVMAMSLYPKEGNPLWEKYSTEAVLQTLETYGRMTFDFPYPKAVSVHTDRIGMEYPMICFNGGRPEPDGTYSKRTKYRMISVIIHEVGHNFFPMIVNSDERQWTWMDEGFNTFLQYLTEQEFERGYPSERGEPRNIVDYMRGDPSGMVPIMTNSELILQFGNNAYGKPATALNILRETVMGRELFDYAFQTYAQRWKFKNPTPSDFFRTMEDASAVDLDWFWRGWFFGTNHVDIGIDNVKWMQLDNRDPEANREYVKNKRKFTERSISDRRNDTSIVKTREEKNPRLQDFYAGYDKSQVDAIDRKAHQSYLNNLDEGEKARLDSVKNYYQVSFVNEGGLVMPLLIRLTYENGGKDWRKIPAEIWQRNNKKVSKVIVTDRPVKEIALDPYQQTADTDMGNNYWPRRSFPSRFEIYKRKHHNHENAMQRRHRSDKMKNQ